MQETGVRSPIQEDPPAAEELSPRATTTDPGLQSPCVSNTGACVPCMLCSATRAATVVRNPCIAAREKPTQQQRPSITQNKINRLKIFFNILKKVPLGLAGSQSFTDQNSLVLGQCSFLETLGLCVSDHSNQPNSVSCSRRTTSISSLLSVRCQSLCLEITYSSSQAFHVACLQSWGVKSLILQVSATSSSGASLCCLQSGKVLHF